MSHPLICRNQPDVEIVFMLTASCLLLKFTFSNFDLSEHACPVPWQPFNPMAVRLKKVSWAEEVIFRFSRLWRLGMFAPDRGVPPRPGALRFARFPPEKCFNFKDSIFGWTGWSPPPTESNLTATASSKDANWSLASELPNPPRSGVSGMHCFQVIWSTNLGIKDICLKTWFYN